MKNKEIRLKAVNIKKTITHNEPIVIARYSYENEIGEIVYEIIRMKNAKQPFYVVSYDSEGKEIFGLKKGVVHIPYNLPNIIKAKKEKDVILITEGESKADILNQLGFVATTAPFKRCREMESDI